MVNETENVTTTITAIMISPPVNGLSARFAIYVDDQLVYEGNSYDEGIQEVHKSLQLEFKTLHMTEGPETFPSKMTEGFLDDYIYAELNDIDEEEDGVDDK
jgi:hypothetical protein